MLVGSGLILIIWFVFFNNLCIDLGRFVSSFFFVEVRFLVSGMVWLECISVIVVNRVVVLFWVRVIGG